MLGSRFLKHEQGKHGVIYRALESGFEAMTRSYDYTLKKALRHSFTTILIAFAMLAGTVYLFFTMPTGFIPSQDSGFMFGVTMAARTSPSTRWPGISSPSRKSCANDPAVTNIGALLRKATVDSFL